ncbi:hypothetical protein AKJ16_DCAP19596 [Drosera capensis]
MFRPELFGSEESFRVLLDDNLMLGNGQAGVGPSHYSHRDDDDSFDSPLMRSPASSVLAYVDDEVGTDSIRDGTEPTRPVGGDQPERPARSSGRERSTRRGRIDDSQRVFRPTHGLDFTPIPIIRLSTGQRQNLSHLPCANFEA